MARTCLGRASACAGGDRPCRVSVLVNTRWFSARVVSLAPEQRAPGVRVRSRRAPVSLGFRTRGPGIPGAAAPSEAAVRAAAAERGQLCSRQRAVRPLACALRPGAPVLSAASSLAPETGCSCRGLARVVCQLPRPDNQPPFISASSGASARRARTALIAGGEPRPPVAGRSGSPERGQSAVLRDPAQGLSNSPPAVSGPGPESGVSLGVRQLVFGSVVSSPPAPQEPQCG